MSINEINKSRFCDGLMIMAIVQEDKYSNECNINILQQLKKEVWFNDKNYILYIRENRKMSGSGQKWQKDIQEFASKILKIEP